MKKWLKTNFKPYMIRPIIYKGFTRFLIGLVIALLWNRFINRSAFYSVTSFAFPILGFVFIGMAWFSFLGMDGMKLHGKKKKETKEKKINYGDMADFVDTEVSFDDLDDNEKSACNLAANLLCSVIFFVLSIF
jgi:hypothetical protein